MECTMDIMVTIHITITATITTVITATFIMVRAETQEAELPHRVLRLRNYTQIITEVILPNHQS